MSATLNRSSYGRTLARIEVLKTESIENLTKLADAELGRIMKRPPFSTYELDRSEPSPEAFPLYHLVNPDPTARNDVWAVTVDLHPCDEENWFLRIRLCNKP